MVIPQKVIKYALLCMSCDIPSGRKVYGFLGHAAVPGVVKV